MDKLQAVIFDMDGTLLDSAPDFVQITNNLRAQYNLPPLPSEQIRQVVSGGAPGILKTAFNLTPSDAAFNERKNELLNLYEQQCYKLTAPFAGILDLVEYLVQNQIKWAVATNKSQRFSLPIMRRLNLDVPLFCPEDVANSKPAPDMVLAACAKLKVAPKNAVYVGDDLRDIQAGKAAGCVAIAAAWGYINHQDDVANWQADFIADSVQSLTQILKRML